MLYYVAPVVLIAFTVACGGSAPASAPAAAPSRAAAAPAAEAPKPVGTLTLFEPIEGAMGGHIDMFRWSAVEGADAYIVRIQAVQDGRVVWESPALTTTETKLPATVSLEPEPHTWQVTARKAGQPLVTSAMQKFTITP
ncbi:MAG: hypothetical protein EXQ50_01565 [Acidobacteria bacterium]|nr:hypothetical protein [Acidobacteriota bacterium]